MAKAARIEVHTAVCEGACHVLKNYMCKTMRTNKMRLTKRDRIRATEELLSLLAANPLGMTTSQLAGTPKFHGLHTLSHRQISKLLRGSDKVEHSYNGYGYMAASHWRLRASTIHY
jgi:hypothetical protein